MKSKFFSKKIIIPTFILFGGFLIAAGVFLFLNFKGDTLAFALQSPKWAEETGSGVSIPACGSSSTSVTCSGGSPSLLFDWTTAGPAPDGTVCNTAAATIFPEGTNFFPDSSSYNHTVTNISNARLSISQSKFGNASAFLGGDGSYFEIPDSDSWYFGTGNFTIDMWVRFNSLPSESRMVLISQLQDVENNWYFNLLNTGGNYYWLLSGNVAISPASSTIVSTNTWYHIALVRNGSNWYFFQNGVQIGSTVVNSAPISNFPAPLHIGEGNNSAWLNGWIDELRISKGVARWVSNFTPPSIPHSSDAFTQLLLHTDVPSNTTIIGGLACSGSYNWIGGSSNTNYNYEIRFETSTGGYNGHLISRGNFITPNCVLPPGDFTLSLSSSSSVACNSVPLSWTASPNATAYRILRGSPMVDISPYQPYTALNFNDTSVSQNTGYLYQIEAYNTSGVNRSNTINVTTPYCPPAITFSGSPTAIDEGGSSTLIWSSSGATSCTTSGAWSGSRALSGSEVVFPAPPPSATYNLQCSGIGGTTSPSIIINIVRLPVWREIIPR